MEEMHRAMTETGVKGALVVQPSCYGQDYSYLEAAAAAYPGFYKGMLVADPKAPDPVAALRAQHAKDPSLWVGVRFNPYTWEGSMADTTGHALFAAAGQLGLPVGFMTFKGLEQHAEDICSLMDASPSTKAA